MPNTHPLSDAQVASFIADGYVRIDGAFPADLADECRAILWRDTGVSPDDPTTWTRPVIRLGHYAQPPFRAAANTASASPSISRAATMRWPNSSSGAPPATA